MRLQEQTGGFLTILRNLLDWYINLFFGRVFVMLGLVIRLGLILLAGYLAWNCYQNRSTIIRYFLTITAVLFNWLYLIYYGIYHVALGNPC